jgi:hypothetical protein
LLFDGTRNGTPEYEAGLLDVWVNYERSQPNTSSLTSTWQVDEDQGVMFITGSTGDIRTLDKYGDFVLEFDYKINGNQGFQYRVTLCGGQTWESGVEYAFDNNYDNPKGSPGAAYALFEPEYKNFHYFEDPDPWNRVVIIGIKDSIEHWQNDELLLSYRFWSRDFVDNYNNSLWTGIPCKCRPYDHSTQEISSDGYVKEGYFGIQGNHGGDLYIKNIKVLPVVPGCPDSTQLGYVEGANYEWGENVCSGPAPGGCRDPEAQNYDPGAQWHDSSSCVYETGMKRWAAHSDMFSIEKNRNSIRVGNFEFGTQYDIELLDVKGGVAAQDNVTGRRSVTLPVSGSGMYVISVITACCSFSKKVFILP